MTYLRGAAGAGARVGITGYCFGGRYAFRLADASRAVHADVAFAAHPSRLQDNETAAVGVPISVAAAGTWLPAGMLALNSSYSHNLGRIFHPLTSPTPPGGGGCLLPLISTPHALS